MIYEFDFDITFCAGVRNILADHLSRLLYPDDADQTLERGEQVIDTQVETKAASKTAKENRDNSPHVTSETNSENSNTMDKITSQMEMTKLNNVTDQIIAASRIDKYTQPQDDEEKQNIISQCHLAGH